MDDVHGKPGHLIRRAHQVSTALFAEELGALDLTAVQYAALVAVREHPGIDATRVSALVAFDRSTLGDVLERLETKGLLARGPSPGDRRVKTLTLTDAGADLLRRAAPAIERVQARLLAPLSTDERAVFVRLLGCLVDGRDQTGAPVAIAEMCGEAR